VVNQDVPQNRLKLIEGNYGAIIEGKNGKYAVHPDEDGDLLTISYFVPTGECREHVIRAHIAIEKKCLGDLVHALAIVLDTEAECRDREWCHEAKEWARKIVKELDH